MRSGNDKFGRDETHRGIATRRDHRIATWLAVFLVLAAPSLAGWIVAAEEDRLSVSADRDWAPTDAWPVFRGNPKSTGVASGQLPADLALLWEFPVKGGAFEGTAAIVDGVVYIGDLDGTMFALDLDTGKPRWQTKTDLGFIASPAVRDGRVYLGDFDGVFYCFDAKTGKVLWKLETDGEINSSANFYRQHVLVGSQDATLYCVDALTGKLVWKFAISDQIRCTPTIVEDRAFVAGCDSMLHIVDLTKGEDAAQVEIDAPTMVTPAVQGQQVFFGTEGGTIYAVNWRQAKVDWTFVPARNAQSVRSSPAVFDGLVVIGNRARQVQALDAKTGVEAWSFLARQRVDSSPVIVGDRVFVGSSDGRLYALELKTGKKVWEFEAGGGLTASPAVAQGRLVIASDDGVVYCFGKKKEE